MPRRCHWGRNTFSRPRTESGRDAGIGASLSAALLGLGRVSPTPGAAGRQWAPVQPVWCFPRLHDGPVPWEALGDTQLTEGETPDRETGRARGPALPPTCFGTEEVAAPTKLASLTIEQRPDHDAAETEGSRRWPCVTGHVRGGALAVASAATPLCAGSRVPDRKDLAPGGAVSAVLRGRRGGVGACSARGLSWLIKGDVGQEVASPSLAMGKDPVAACVQACPQLGLWLARKKDKALRTDSRVPPSSPQFPRRRSGQLLPEARRGKASAGGGRPHPAPWLELLPGLS